MSILLLSACTSRRSDPIGNPLGTSVHALNDISAARFLDQATFGSTLDDIEHLSAIGFESWLDEQIASPVSTYPNVCCSGTVQGVTCNEIIPCNPGDFDTYPSSPGPGCGRDGPCIRDNYSMWRLQRTFFQYALTAPDQLRQRMVFALNQTLVTSAVLSDINMPSRMVSYLHVLENDAFGNFLTLLHDMTLNPTMGRFLDLISDTVDQPNENYPRELLQLFSVGPYLLNPDGTQVLDDEGHPVPTYGQAEVVELTRALSGWILAPQLGPGLPNYKDPLRPIDARHDFGSKVLFGGVLPADQSVEDDLNQALNIIFNHPNVGPYIGKSLIQKLVTSNPSPAYVARVTQVFNNNGSGVRGDLAAVLRAILIDPEARDDAPPPGFGKLREPVLSITAFLKKFGQRQFGEIVTDYALSDLSLRFGNTANLKQNEDLFTAPSVFNFFPPDFPLPGESGLVGPEFGILSITTSLSRANLYYRIIYELISTEQVYRPLGTRLDTSSLIPLGDDPAFLVETLNQNLLHGTMSDPMREIVVNTISGGSQTNQNKVREAIYLVATSAAFQVQR